MKWFSHMAIAASTTAVVAPALVPVAILGSTAPDWLEWVLRAMGRRVKHRTITHIVVYWIGGMLFGLFLWDWHGVIAGFAYGGLTHVLADSLTIAGVPLLPTSERRFNLFGGRLRTGGSGEFFVAGGITVVCFFLATSMHSKSDFFPFFYNWQGMYEEGLIDGAEWKANRLKFI